MADPIYPYRATDPTSTLLPDVLRGVDGRPMRLYHGTGAVFTEFDANFSPNGFWFTNSKHVASRVAMSPHAEMVGGLRNVRIAYLRMRAPLRVRHIDHVHDAIEMLLEDRSRFDGLIWTCAGWAEMGCVPFIQYVVFEPGQVLPPWSKAEQGRRRPCGKGAHRPSVGRRSQGVRRPVAPPAARVRRGPDPDRFARTR